MDTYRSLATFTMQTVTEMGVELCHVIDEHGMLIASLPPADFAASYELIPAP